MNKDTLIEKIDFLFYTCMNEKDYRVACKILELMLKYGMHMTPQSPPEIPWETLTIQDIEHYLYQIIHIMKKNKS
jgi:hypothetical protein